MSKELIDFEEKLKFVLSKEIFYEKPSNNKNYLVTLIYFFIVITSAFLDLWYVAGIFSLAMITYLIAAKGVVYTTLVVGITSLLSYTIADLWFSYWNIILGVLSYILFRSIQYRYSKVFIVMLSTAFLFFTSTVYLAFSMKFELINFTPQKFQSYIDLYMNSVKEFSTETDMEIFRQSFEQIKRYLPTIVFSVIFIYTLLILQYAFSFLSKQKAIVPVFPKFSYIKVKSFWANMYLILMLFVWIISLTQDNSYDLYYLLLDNVYAIFRWMFVFNGLFTALYFLDYNKQNSIFSKGMTFIGAYLFSGLFEIIGVVDSLFGLREYFARRKGDK